MGRHLATLALTLTLAACHVGRFPYATPALSPGGAAVLVLEPDNPTPAGCQHLRQTRANNLHGDPQYMRIALQNHTAEYGGNVLLLTGVDRDHTEGAVYHCPPDAMPTPIEPEPADLPPPPPPATTPEAGAKPSADARALLHVSRD